MFELIKNLTQIDGISGREQNVREYIIKQIDGKCDYYVDNLGNIIAFKKGKKQPKNKIMLSAHMDEVGMIVTNITADGLLRIAAVGGVDPRVIIGRAVKINDEVNGVIGTKAVHQQSSAEREKAVQTDNLFVDIGAKDKADAETAAALGDSVTFVSEYAEFGDDFVVAKALDDRIGCAILINLIGEELEYDVNFAFCVQEEVGLRGAKAATETISPDVAIVIEATTAADLSDVESHKKVCCLGDGAVVGFMDRSTIYNKELYDLAFTLAEQNGIKIQTKTLIAGGNDAGAIQTAHGGAKVLAISVPTRYIHSPSCVAKKSDIIEVYKLTKLMISRGIYV